MGTEPAITRFKAPYPISRSWYGQNTKEPLGWSTTLAGPGSWSIGREGGWYGKKNTHILSTARRFEKIAGKWGGVEYLILNIYSPRGHVQWNVQSIGDIISFRIYDFYFYLDVRGHGTGVTLPKSMRVDLFCCCCFFAIFLQIFPSFSLFVSLFLFSFLLGIYLIFLFWPCLFTETNRAFEKRQGQSRFSENSIFQVFFGICKLLVSSQYVIHD